MLLALLVTLLLLEAVPVKAAPTTIEQAIEELIRPMANPASCTWSKHFNKPSPSFDIDCPNGYYSWGYFSDYVILDRNKLRIRETFIRIWRTQNSHTYEPTGWWISCVYLDNGQPQCTLDN